MDSVVNGQERIGSMILEKGVDFDGDFCLEEVFCKPVLLENLNKIHEIHALDMYEFLVEFMGMGIGKFIRTLSILTYFELSIYKVDDAIENGKDVDIKGLEYQLIRELKRLGLYSEYFGSVICGLTHDIKKTILISKLDSPTVEDILSHTRLKTADLTFLRYLALQANGIEVEHSIMEFFLHIDYIREFFDDIRDYDEDTGMDFNCIQRFEKTLDRESPASVIKNTIMEDMKSARKIAHNVSDSDAREKLNRILAKVGKEIEEHLRLIP